MLVLLSILRAVESGQKRTIQSDCLGVSSGYDTGIPKKLCSLQVSHKGLKLKKPI